MSTETWPELIENCLEPTKNRPELTRNRHEPTGATR